MAKRIAIAAAAALLASVSASQASIVINGSYAASSTTISNPTYTPTINYNGQPYLHSPFSESLTVGATTTPTTFLQISPANGSGSFSITGTLRVVFSGLSDGSAATSVNYNGNAATFSNGSITVNGYYDMNYQKQTDCITWSSTGCTPPSTGNTTTIGDTLGITFADGAVLDVNLYNWSDWDMAPNISFDLVQGPNVPAVPEPASLALLGTSLAGLGALLWRRRQAATATSAAA